MTNTFPKLMWALLLLFSLSFSALGAETKTTIQRFGEGDLPVIHTKVRFTTLILLPEGEEISEVTCGDKEFWVIEGKDGIVYVKPAKEGAQTNVNVVSKSKVVYSFMVQEITKPGSKDKEKPDLKVVLGGDEVLKLRKDKENLEEALAKSEAAAKKAAEQSESDAAGKKKENEVVPPKPEAPKTEPIAPVASPEAKGNAVTTPRPPVAVATPQVPPAAPAPSQVEEKPLVTTYVIERHDGLIRKSGRAIGHFFRKISEALRIY